MLSARPPASRRNQKKLSQAMNPQCRTLVVCRLQLVEGIAAIGPNEVAADLLDKHLIPGDVHQQVSQNPQLGSNEKAKLLIGAVIDKVRNNPGVQFRKFKAILSRHRRTDLVQLLEDKFGAELPDDWDENEDLCVPSRAAAARPETTPPSTAIATTSSASPTTSTSSLSSSPTPTALAPASTSLATPTKPEAKPSSPPVARSPKPPRPTPQKPPVATPTKPPIATPAKPPIATPTKPPVATPTKAPVATPTKPPVATPTKPLVDTPINSVGPTLTNPVAATPTNPISATPTKPLPDLPTASKPAAAPPNESLTPTTESPAPAISPEVTPVSHPETTPACPSVTESDHSEEIDSSSQADDFFKWLRQKGIGSKDLQLLKEQDISVTVYGLFQQDESLYKQLSKGLLAILKYSNVKAELVRRFGETMCKTKPDANLSRNQVSSTGLQNVPVEMEDSDNQTPNSLELTDADLAEVFVAVKNACGKWYEIGLELKVDAAALADIEETIKPLQSRLRETLRIWLLNGGQTRTWVFLVDTMRSRLVSRPDIGDKILTDR